MTSIAYRAVFYRLIAFRPACSIAQFSVSAGSPVRWLSSISTARKPLRVQPRSGRQSFAEQFRRMLCRQFPAWNIETLTSAIDLRRSFSAAFPRAHLARGNRHVAALACPSPDAEPAILTSALLWFDYLRAQIGSLDQLSLCLFLPERAGNLTAHRLHWLSGIPLRTRLFLFNQHGMAGEVDPKDLGNLETRLTSHYTPAQLSPELKLLVSRLAGQSNVGCCPEVNGAISIRFRGLEFARIEGGQILLGIETKEQVGLSETRRVEEFASNLAPLIRALPAFPERWFESSVRSNLEILDPSLLSEPVHGQILTFAGGERQLIDLLAISRSGELAVLELKAAEDMHLPIQALDYWMRVCWHGERQELQHLFPGRQVAAVNPKLLLIAPALMFHSTNEIILRYFSPAIEVERIGVNSDWDSALRVAFRLRDAEVPISHRGPDEARRISQYQEGD
ncbi:MAG: hypothetical protein M3Y72_01300 [Acidobacteriota bacterium]|nr:hypothetical protein [Acidobacteriota bacterium]